METKKQSTGEQANKGTNEQESASQAFAVTVAGNTGSLLRRVGSRRISDVLGSRRVCHAFQEASTGG